MRAGAMVPVTAIIGALVLNTFAARGQAAPPDPPSSSEERQLSVPSSQPGPEPKPVRPDSAPPAVGPMPALSGATPQPPSFAEPKMIHETRSGFVLAGSLMFVPAYLLQVLAAAGISLS